MGSETAGIPASPAIQNAAFFKGCVVTFVKGRETAVEFPCSMTMRRVPPPLERRVRREVRRELRTPLARRDLYDLFREERL